VVRRTKAAARFIFFAGKGGVGKTTCAAAWARAQAEAGRRVLAVSTDPAHSLGDALGVPLSARPSPVRSGRRRFHAAELNGPRAFERWLRTHRQALGEVLEHGTWLDREDIDALLELSVPGIDELVAMLEIVRLAGHSTGRDGDVGYDLVIVDTAPTGHTLRLLTAPEAVAAVAGVLEGLQREHRLIRDRLARVARPEAADQLIALLAEQAHGAGALLRDPDRALLHWVLLPEALSVAESEDGLRALDRAHIKVSDVIVNRVLPDGPPCPICDRRREYERTIVRSVLRSPGRGRAVHVVHAEPDEPRTSAALARIGAELRSGPEGPARKSMPAGLKVRTPAASTVLSLREDVHTISPDDILACQGARLLLFGGKGGVGKTTAAAATALRLARTSVSRRVLLISIDPAHSLSDVFGVAIGDRPITLPGGPRNLHVRELDAKMVLAARRTPLDAALNDIAGAVGANRWTATGGRDVSRLMDLAPPGIDELFGILSVAELLAPARESMPSDGKQVPSYDLVVVDTAATGHALRFLELPDAARDWVQLLLRVLLKYRQIVPPGQLAAELVELSKSVRALQALLHNPVDTRFIVVTRAAAVPRLETERLIRRLRRLRLAVPAVVVNAMTLAPRQCGWCRATALAERREVFKLVPACRRGSRECAIILAPLAAPPPRGIAALERWGTVWQQEPTSTA
jgi:arsenite/tail-anchored protein-transporting ATPase